ncbi:MAG: NAD(P)/FAD-dependent oxidoreductase, partial [Solirubrobacterales bacterium]
MSGIAVIGGGIAAQALIESLRKVDREVPVTLYCAESHLPYDRVRLTELVEKDATVDDLRLRPDDWYEDNAIEVITGARVEALDSAARTVTHDGATRRFEKVVLATGSEALVPPIDGVDRQGVFLYRYPTDCEMITEHGEPGKHAAVIGGGLLGLEAAKALAARGCKVTVVHLMDRLMERQLDAAAADLLLAAMKELDVEVLTERSTAQITGNGSVDGLVFADGERLDCDFVVVSVGITARTDLAREAGIEVERGIVVDDAMQTSAPGVYAVGECAQHNGIVYGIVAPIYDQCDVAAKALTQSEAPPYSGSIPSAKLKVMGVDLVSIGDVTQGETVTASDPGGRVYRKLAVSDGKLTGAVLMGDTRGYELLLDMAKTEAEIIDPLAT